MLRNVLPLLDFDYGYSYAIFAYGGFLGLLLGLLLNCKYRGERTTARHRWYIGNSFSGALSFFGACIIFCLMPILAMDPSFAISSLAPHAIYTVPQCVWYSISASVLISTGGSIIVHGKPIARDLINGVVAGGVSSLSASFYITNPVWAMILGAASGILQLLGQSLIETSWSKTKPIINTYSFTVFGAQAILGGIFGAIYRASINNVNNRDGFTLDTEVMPAAGYNLLIAVISAGFGIVFGIVIGILLLITGRHKRYEHFHDYTYWVPDDGIRYYIPKDYYSS